MAEPGELKEGVKQSAERGKQSIELAKKGSETAEKVKKAGEKLAKKIRSALKTRLKSASKSKGKAPRAKGVGRKAGHDAPGERGRAAAERSAMRRQIRVAEKHIKAGTSHTNKFRNELARAGRLSGSTSTGGG